MGWKHERGEGKAGCIIGLVILAAAVIVAVKAVPVKVAVAELKDFCERQAEGASLPRHTDELILSQIIIKAQQLNLPVSAADVKVWRDGSMVHIEAKYRVIIDFPFYTYPWDVYYKIDRILF